MVVTRPFSRAIFKENTAIDLAELFRALGDPSRIKILSILLDGEGNLCIHYDADYVPLAQVERWAKEAGVRVQQRYRHDKLHIANMDCADCAVSIEKVLGRRPGVLNVSVSYPAEKMWVEYDNEQITQRDVIAVVK